MMMIWMHLEQLKKSHQGRRFPWLLLVVQTGWFTSNSTRVPFEGDLIQNFITTTTYKQQKQNIILIYCDFRI
eukprot:m.30821 g.30821  ORF g.30821 m.30821 type:complete len:72 (+) comp8244_c0_seq1:2651-2866(+)